MKIDTQSHGTIATLIPHGPLVADEVPDFQRAVESAAQGRAGRVVLDLSDVPYLDSAGIEALLAVGTALQSPTARSKFACLTDTCREALDLTDVLPRLEVFDTVDHAIRSFNR